MRRSLPLFAFALAAAFAAAAAADLSQPGPPALQPACDPAAEEAVASDALSGAVPLTYTCAECNQFFLMCLDDCDASPYPGCYNDCRAGRFACYQKCLGG